MPYSETHEITIGPITLPDGVTIEVTTATGTGGRQSVTIAGSTASSREDTVALLQAAFAGLIVAASSEGVGEPVFVSPAQPVLGAPPAPAPVIP